MKKKDRFKAILDLISENDISTQEELTLKLNERGFNVSQATVSRDINELDIIKIESGDKKSAYRQAKVADAEMPFRIKELFKNVVVSIVAANNLIVVKTLNGNANTAGMAVDQMDISQIIGTVAGDDTLLVVTRSNADAEITLKILRSI